MDWPALHHYLTWGATPATRSAFAGIAKLAPGHTATFAAGVLTPRRYWTLPAGTPTTFAGLDARELGQAVRREVREAVRLRLESDVPVGAFLSGGVDSSVVVASMREVTSGRITTFSIGFGASAASYDELPYARQVAERFGTEHHEEILEPKAAELAPIIVRAFDEPFADSSAIPTFAVAAATARHVKVALSGIGGDEAFAGYPRYLGLRVSEWWARVPRALRVPAGALAARALGESYTSRNLRDWLLRFTAGGEQPLPDRYLTWTRFFGAGDLTTLATPALRARLDADVEGDRRAAWAARGHGDPMDGAFRIDLATYLPDDLLVMADRMSMASSLELRAPFCDHRLIEASLSIAPSVKTRGLPPQVAAQDDLRRRAAPRRAGAPKARLHDPAGPLAAHGPAPAHGRSAVAERVRARGLFQPAAVEALKAEHVTGRRAHGDRLWTLMMAELWLREYLDRGLGVESRVRAPPHPRHRRRLAAQRPGRRGAHAVGAGPPARPPRPRRPRAVPGARGPSRRPRSCARACASWSSPRCAARRPTSSAARWSKPGGRRRVCSPSRTPI